MSTEMILVNSEELTLSDFVEDGVVKRGLFYRGMRVTTAGCPSPANHSGWWSGKEWVRPIQDKKGEDR